MLSCRRSATPTRTRASTPIRTTSPRVLERWARASLQRMCGSCASCSSGNRAPLRQTPYVSEGGPSDAPIECDADGAVIAAHDVGMDFRGLHGIAELCRHEEVIDPPSHVTCTGVGDITTPRVMTVA